MDKGNEQSDGQYGEEFWKKQYELLTNWQIQEAHLFWTRFQISQAINAGLLIAYSAILGLRPESS
jgi:hypothetical protein